MKRHAFIVLAACGARDDKPPPAPVVTPPTVVATSPADAMLADAASPDAYGCGPAIVTVDGVVVPIQKVVSIDVVGRMGYRGRQLKVFLDGPKPPPCATLVAGSGFEMGHHWFALHVTDDGGINPRDDMKSISATNAGFERIQEMTVEAANPLTFCLRSPVTLDKVQWDSMQAPTRTIAFVGSVAAAEHCGTKQY